MQRNHRDAIGATALGHTDSRLPPGVEGKRRAVDLRPNASDGVGHDPLMEFRLYLGLRDAPDIAKVACPTPGCDLGWPGPSPVPRSRPHHCDHRYAREGEDQLLQQRGL